MAKLGEGERQVRLGQDRLAIKRKRAESIYVVLPAPHRLPQCSSLLALKVRDKELRKLHSTDSRGQSYITFYCRNLRISVIS